jgi:hypothetical protein
MITGASFLPSIASAQMLGGKNTFYHTNPAAARKEDEAATRQLSDKSVKTANTHTKTPTPTMVTRPVTSQMAPTFTTSTSQAQN